MIECEQVRSVVEAGDYSEGALSTEHVGAHRGK